MSSGQLVPPPGPSEDEHGGHVGEIGDGPVRVPTRIRRLAAAVRLDPLAYLAVGVGPAAGLQVVRDRHRPVRDLAVEDPVAADHAGVADVDHAAAVVDVQPDAEPDEEQRGDGERPHRPDGGGRPRPCGRPEADPCGSHSQVDERRNGERGALEDVASVEEGERDPEREQDEKIDRPHRQRTPQVGEPQEEDRGEAHPHRPRGQQLAAERARPAAGHLPRHLRPRPRLDHVAVVVRDRPGRDLTGFPGPDVHRPRPLLAVERRVRLGLRRVAVEPARRPSDT